MDSGYDQLSSQNCTHVPIVCCMSYFSKNAFIADVDFKEKKCGSLFKSFEVLLFTFEVLDCCFQTRFLVFNS